MTLAPNTGSYYIIIKSNISVTEPLSVYHGYASQRHVCVCVCNVHTLVPLERVIERKMKG